MEDYYRNDELEDTWKEAAIAYTRYVSVSARLSWVKPRQTSFRIAGVRAEIRTEHLINMMNVERYRYTNSLHL
jgi:hypothetical protein